ncbi:MAG: AsnC family protein, partial [Microbacteriaceae bacterium]
LAAIHATVAEAWEFPVVFVGPGDDTDPERIDFAVRAAVAELATSLGVSEQTIRARLHEAGILHTRLRTVWTQFCEGEIPYPNVRVIIEHSVGLPDDPAVWAEYDTKLAGPPRNHP